MSLLEALKTEAIRRGLISDTKESLNEKDVFFLVRDMPYKRATSRAPETTIQEWKGTCSGKHYVLQALFKELGYSSKLMACSHYIGNDVITKLPAEMQAMFSGKRIPDIHNYLKLELSSGDMIVDATWPPETEAYGLIINKAFILGQDMALSCEPIAYFEVPEGVDPQEHKQALLEETFYQDELKLRDMFFQLIA